MKQGVQEITKKKYAFKFEQQSNFKIVFPAWIISIPRWTFMRFKQLFLGFSKFVILEELWLKVLFMRFKQIV